jgi:glycosyltransferase involved in cell wall biosynthesis
MYRGFRVAAVIPAYNEERLIARSVNELPDFVDLIVATNDGSTDATLEVLNRLAEENKKLVVLDNERNRGIGYTIVRGLKEALARDADLFVPIAGDAQSETTYLSRMCDMLIDERLDYVKANRFYDLKALRKMPRFRRIGNVVISLINKFATGYYSIFDSQNGYGVFPRATLEKLPFELIGERYDYENTLLLALGVIKAKVKDIPVPAVYGDEVSTIKFFPTMRRALSVLFVGYWRRIYLQYVLFNFHPLALFLVAGTILTAASTAFGLFVAYMRIFMGSSPSSGTVMLVVLPFLVGFQLLLTAMVMDVNNEGRS